MAVRPGGATDPASRINRLVDFQERRFRETWTLAVRTLRDRFTLDSLATLLEQGRFEEALAGLEEAGSLLGNRYGESLSASARNTAAWMSAEALDITVSFDQTNFRAVQRMQANRLRLIREFTSDQRGTLRQAMTRGITEGLNPRDQARLFRDSIGLTRRQEAAVANYGRLLRGQDRLDNLPSMQALDRQLRDGRFDRTVRAAVRRGEPLTEEQVSRMVGRYRERYVRYRSEVIGRTEALRSVHEGSEEMYQQAFEAGQIDPGKVSRSWTSARDGRVRDTHRSINGQTRLVGERFTSPSGAQLRYPGDPDAPAEETVQCRCALATRVNP